MPNRAYKVIKLKTGETLFCGVDEGLFNTDKMWVLYNAVEVSIMRGFGPPRVDMRKWCPFSDDEEATLSEDMVLSVASLRPPLIVEYLAFLDQLEKAKWEEETHNAVFELLKSVSVTGDVRMLDIDDEREMHKQPPRSELLDDDTDGFYTQN